MCCKVEKEDTLESINNIHCMDRLFPPGSDTYGSLQDYLCEKRTLLDVEAANILTQLCEVVSDAHKRYETVHHFFSKHGKVM